MLVGHASASGLSVAPSVTVGHLLHNQERQKHPGWKRASPARPVLESQGHPAGVTERSWLLQALLRSAGMASCSQWFMHQIVPHPSAISHPGQSRRSLWTEEFLDLPQHLCHRIKSHERNNVRLCKMFLKHQNFNMVLQISLRDKKSLLFRSSSRNQLVTLLSYKPVG